MVETLVTKNKFKIIFEKDSHEIDIDYSLADTELAEKWLHKISRVKYIPIDPLESNLDDVSDLQGIYKKFCKEYKIKEIKFDFTKQSTLNTLHKIYEDNHDNLSIKKNNQLLYKFHHAIHETEEPTINRNKIKVSWGVKEGPLAEKFNCMPFYQNKIKKLHIYLHWSELGKKPFSYWKSKEPNLQERFNELCLPHITLRCQFFIPICDILLQPFPTGFDKWFENFKEAWLIKHKLKKWDHIDEFGAPLLAIPLTHIDCHDLNFKKIVI